MGCALLGVVLADYLMGETLDNRRAAFPEEREKWLYIIDTYWAMPPEYLIFLIGTKKTLDELYSEAQSMRDGMIAT